MNIDFNHKAFENDNESHLAAVRKLAPQVATSLDVNVNDVAEWLYEGERMTGNESVDALVKQWNDEH